MCARPPFSGAYFDLAYVNTLPTTTPHPGNAEQLCRIYGSRQPFKKAEDKPGSHAPGLGRFGPTHKGWGSG